MIDEAVQNKGNITGLTTGFKQIDEMTAGLQPGNLVIIAGRPGMGKTAFALNIAERSAINAGASVLIFSIEMPAEEIGQRLISMHGRIESEKLKKGNLDVSDWENINYALNALNGTKIVIDSTQSITVTEMRNKCRRLKLEQGLDLVVVDYLQLMKGDDRSENRQQEISDISRSLKALARELQAPVIALSQLSRACETRTDHRPMLSDLRESGAIEQDADVVMFLYRDDYYNKDTDHPNEAEVIIAKQRNGPIGTVNLLWRPEYTKFVNMARPQGGGNG